MKIAIEAQRIFRKNKHGMDFVALEIIRELQKTDKTNQYLIFVAPGEDRCLEETDNFSVIELKMPSYPLWEQVALPAALKKHKPDIVHCTSNTAPVFCPVPLMITLHDIIFLEKEFSGNKSFYQRLGRIYRRLVVPKILPICKKIITVSEFERQKIEHAIPEIKSQLTSVYNGYNPHFCPKDKEDVNKILKKYNLPSDFLFFLGNTDPKKNTHNTLIAYASYLKKSRKRLPLVMADIQESYLDSILSELQMTEIRSQIICIGYVSNSDLPYIYNAASVFLYVSLKESFGIPILEAMACGTPIITSNVTSMPEIAGKGAETVDPYDPQSIVESLIKVEENESLRLRLIDYGLERVKHFSWQQTAKQMLDIYESLNHQTNDRK